MRWVHSSSAASTARLLAGEALACPNPDSAWVGILERIAIGGWLRNLTRDLGAALDASPQWPLADLRHAKFLFESFVVRDLCILSALLNGTVWHHRDSDGVEADVVPRLLDSTWGAFEVTLGSERVDGAVASLHAFRNAMDTSKIGELAVLGAITTAAYGNVRNDGVSVTPIGSTVGCVSGVIYLQRITSSGETPSTPTGSDRHIPGV